MMCCWFRLLGSFNVRVIIICFDRFGCMSTCMLALFISVYFVFILYLHLCLDLLFMGHVGLIVFFRFM